MMIDLSATDIGKSWVGQFSIDDQALAVELIDSISLVSQNEFFERLKKNILDSAKPHDHLIGLYAEREIRKRDGKPHKLFKEPDRKKNRRAYGAGPKPVEPMSNNTPEVGSEGIVSTLITELCREQPKKFINHPGPNLIRNNKIRSFFIIADFIGSGKRASDYLDSAWRVASVKSWHSYKKINFEVLAYSGTDFGIERVKKHKCHPSVSLVLSCPTIETEFTGEKLNRLHLLCRHYDPINNDLQGSLGFGETGALIAFSHGCPNNAPRFIHKSKKGKWKALFPARVTAKTRSIFGDRNDCSSLLKRLEKLGEKRLSTGIWIKDTNDEGRKMLLLLATLKTKPRFYEALSRKTRLIIPEIRMLIEKAQHWKLIDEDRRLTNEGYEQLKKARLPKKERESTMSKTNMMYYPQSLRVPF